MTKPKTGRGLWEGWVVWSEGTDAPSRKDGKTVDEMVIWTAGYEPGARAVFLQARPQD